MASTAGTDSAITSERTDAIVAALAEVLLRSAAPTSGQQPFAVFDCVAAPGMGLVDYARRIFKYFNCSHESSILGLAYIDRFLEEKPDFTLSLLNIHRLFLTSMVVAAKFFDDTYLFNSFYAEVGGVSVQELNMLELKFLEVIRWRLHVVREEYDHFNAAVLDQACSKDDAKHPTRLLVAGFLAERREKRKLEDKQVVKPEQQKTKVPLHLSWAATSQKLSCASVGLFCDIGDTAIATKANDVALQEVSRATSQPLRCARLLRRGSSCRQSLSPAGRRRQLRAVRSAA